MLLAVILVMMRERQTAVERGHLLRGISLAFDVDRLARRDLFGVEVKYIAKEPPESVVVLCVEQTFNGGALARVPKLLVAGGQSR